MRIIKPDTLALMYATWPDHGRGQHGCSLVLACAACFPFAPHVEALLEDTQLWDCANKAIPAGFSFDEGRSKPRGEFLVYGSCHAPATGITRAREVAVRVGDTRKKLTVFGPRFWSVSGPDDPAPFSNIPLTWANAFGGEADPANPLGKGKTPDAEGLRSMPQVEQCDAFISSPTDKRVPAGLSALDPGWTSRLARTSVYNRNWYETRWPDMPEDTHPEYFMLAPQDQWMPEFFHGNETFALAGMHPEKEFLEGTLPAIRCRMFVLRNNEQEMAFQELKNQADTLTLFPDSEIGALTFRGVTHTCDEECADILALLTVFEPSALPPESAEYYRRIIEETLEPPAAPPEAGAMPEELHAAPVDEAANDAQESDVSLEPEMENLEQLVAEIEAHTREHLKKIGVSQKEAEALLARLDQEAAVMHPEVSAEKATLKTEDPLESLRRMADEVETQARDMLQKSGKTEEEIDTMLAQQMEKEMPDLAREYAPYLEDPKVPEEIKGHLTEMLNAFAEATAACLSLEELAVPDAASETGPGPEAAEEKTIPALLPERLSREQVLERHARGESLAHTQLSGLDLSGVDLSGAIFQEAFLDQVNFSGSDLTGANLRDADCSQADFSKAILQDADISGALLQKATLRNSNAAKLTARNTRFQEADLSDAIFSEADLEKADFSRAVMNGTNCSDVHAPLLRLQGASLQKADFSGATLFNARADENTDATGANFARADMAFSGLRGANLSQAVLKKANLTSSDLSHCSLRNALLDEATVQEAKVFRSDLSGACLQGADLSSSLLRRASLRNANLNKADLHSADLYQSVMDQASMQGTNLENTLLDPSILENFPR